MLLKTAGVPAQAGIRSPRRSLRDSGPPPARRNGAHWAAAAFLVAALAAIPAHADTVFVSDEQANVVRLVDGPTRRNDVVLEPALVVRGTTAPPRP